MKYLFNLGLLALISLFIISTSTSITNTTDFFNNQIGYRPPFQSFAGYEDIDWYYNGGSAAVYYSLWQGYALPWEDQSVPLIIWLNGGPGESSQIGCFTDTGPVLIEGAKGKQKATQNPWAWNYFGHMMFVDQPVGVGFSFNNDTKKVNSSPQAATHFINFLYNFFKKSAFPGLIRNPLYIAGESYAGHYIPVFANAIMSNSSLGFNLKGVMIGDGWIDPITQINFYDSYLYSVGAVSSYWRDNMTSTQNSAIDNIRKGNLVDAAKYINFLIAADDNDVANKYYLGMNILNYKQYDFGNFNPDFKFYVEEKKKNFGVPDWKGFLDYDDAMYKNFSADLAFSFKSEFEKLLENPNVQVLVYVGQNDFIVNTPGVLEYLNQVNWRYIDDWKKSPKKLWNQFSAKNYGWYKNYRNLIFVSLRDAGHLGPEDQPRTAWAMINKYFLKSW